MYLIGWDLCIHVLLLKYLPEYPGTRLEFLRASNCEELDKEL